MSAKQRAENEANKAIVRLARSRQAARERDTVMDRKQIKSCAWSMHAFHNLARLRSGGLTVGSWVKVKNLGWLVRHRAIVESFEILAPYPMKPWRHYANRLPGGGIRVTDKLRGESGFVLCARLQGGAVYATQYASVEVCLTMLETSSYWRRLPITVEPDASVLIHHRSNPDRLQRLTDEVRAANALIARPLRITYEEE